MRSISKTLLAGILLFVAAGFNGLEAQLARIAEWVSEAPASSNSKIALGYAVPIPVDTPLPFDGFRTYSGLHIRHQDLVNTTPWVHAIQIGETRAGRAIWAYQLGDADHETIDGLPEQAMLTNGGIHAREWQSPEVATGIIELLALTDDDQYLISYLRDNANIMVIPVLNIDGFLQTQRFPGTNWLGTDPDDAQGAPRDGRMRRKNMLGLDETLETQQDHLLGVDLNRNHNPFWNTNSNRSSSNPDSLVHHGASSHSEPESQALLAAAELGPADQLSMYTDMHSFSLVHFWSNTGNDRLANLTHQLLTTFSNHHARFDAGKFYSFSAPQNVALNNGIGTTDELFAYRYQVPSWTLEIEPLNGGSDYGGLGRNSHDGFILPESEINRVRTELAQTFTVAYYQQSGPPSITAVRITDRPTGAVVFEAEWDVATDTSRELYNFQAHPVQLDREYSLWVAFDKPMRWRENGEINVLPGQPASKLSMERKSRLNGEELNEIPGQEQWLQMPGDAPDGYLRYRDDAFSVDFHYPGNDNIGRINRTALATLELSTFDMTGSQVDGDPSTVAHWNNGGWSGYEDSNGIDLTDNGGTDTSIRFQITSEPVGDPFVIEAGTSSAWFDPSRSGEGFMLEILTANRAVMYWFTYDSEGEQDWYMAVGEIRGNRILFPELIQTSGGKFGGEFDPAEVSRTVVGSASFIWSGCDSGAMSWLIDRDGNKRRQGRMNLQRLTRIMGIDCGRPLLAPVREEAQLSGSWYDPAHSGEGIALEVLTDERILLFWFGYDPRGNRRWFFGTGEIKDGKLLFEEMFTTLGGVFGRDFDPGKVELQPWGSLVLNIACESGTVIFSPTEPGFSAGSLNLTRLTVLDGLHCER
jgi:hypothetical protein